MHPSTRHTLFYVNASRRHVFQGVYLQMCRYYITRGSIAKNNKALTKALTWSRMAGRCCMPAKISTGARESVYLAQTIAVCIRGGVLMAVGSAN